MIRSRMGRRRHIDAAELNITAFMNLMVILVPFLLITAVFSRLAILELHLPPSSEEPEHAQTPVFHLEVIVRADRIDVGDRDSGVLRTYPNVAGDYDVRALSASLKEIKDRYPDKTDASILVEPGVSYETIIRVMDSVRLQAGTDPAADVQRDLFPDISIGDAPADGA